MAPTHLSAAILAPRSKIISAAGWAVPWVQMGADMRCGPQFARTAALRSLLRGTTHSATCWRKHYFANAKPEVRIGHR